MNRRATPAPAPPQQPLFTGQAPPRGVRRLQKAATLKMKQGAAANVAATPTAPTAKLPTCASSMRSKRMSIEAEMAHTMEDVRAAPISA